MFFHFFCCIYMLLTVNVYLFQSKLSAHASKPVAHATIEENVPVVDKVVDDGWSSPRASSGLLIFTVKLFQKGYHYSFCII
jgi:hypothetical protein